MILRRRPTTATTEAEIQALLSKKTGVILDVACGFNKQPGAVGMDIRDIPGVDILWDIEEYPWPLPDECANTVICRQIIEHISTARMGFIKFMNEVWRVMKPEGQLAIITPYYTSYLFAADPTHVHGFSEYTWAYFDPLAMTGDGQLHHLYKVYKPKPWKIDGNVHFDPDGMMEVLLRKREEDPSYTEGEILL